MKPNKILFFIFLLSSGISIYYKIYMDDKINDPDKKGSISSLFSKVYNITTLFPRKMNCGDLAERKMRVKANVALLVFFVSLISILIMSKLVKSL
jgi:hypothetical protein